MRKIDPPHKIGMCIAIDLIKRGNQRNFLIFEKSNQVGGTWNDNVFPGCCCDGTFSVHSSAIARLGTGRARRQPMVFA